MRYLVLLLTISCGLPLYAGDGRFTAHIGGGFTSPTFDASDRLDTGWNILAGAGVRVTRNFALLGEFNYNDFEVARSVLRAAGTPDGDARVWSFTANPRYTINPGGRVNFYVTGGGGVYHRTVDFTRPTVAAVTAFDPFFGFFPAAVPAEEVVRSFDTTKGGLNIGGGFDIHLTRQSLKFFAESRYHHMYTSGFGTSFIPVTFGLRW